MIDVDEQCGFARRIQPNGGAEDFWLAHPIRGDFMLHGHNGPDIRMGVIEDACGRRREASERNKSGENSGR